MREASDTDSDPELRHMKCAYGQPPMVWPISLRIARSNFSWAMLGVMMFAITCGLAIASSTACGVWPRPSMP